MRSRLLHLLWFRRLEEEIGEELQFHLVMREAEHRAAGLSGQQAQQAAWRQ